MMIMVATMAMVTKIMISYDQYLILSANGDIIIIIIVAIRKEMERVSIEQCRYN